MATSADSIHFFGIRHHGPGCARSLLQALEQLQPDCLLVEGPPEGEALLPVLQSAELNELQTALHARIAGIAGMLMKEGSIISGAGIILSQRFRNSDQATMMARPLKPMMAMSGFNSAKLWGISSRVSMISLLEGLTPSRV